MFKCLLLCWCLTTFSKLGGFKHIQTLITQSSLWFPTNNDSSERGLFSSFQLDRRRLVSLIISTLILLSVCESPASRTISLNRKVQGGKCRGSSDYFPAKLMLPYCYQSLLRIMQVNIISLVDSLNNNVFICTHTVMCEFNKTPNIHGACVAEVGSWNLGNTCQNSLCSVPMPLIWHSPCWPQTHGDHDELKIT